MIGLLEGSVEDIFYESPSQSASPLCVILLCNGIGFQLLCSKRTRLRLKHGKTARLYVSPQVQIREGNLRLYGFFDKSERDFFNLLVSVQGVGGKLALAILSHFASASLVRAILAADKALLQSVAGLGARTAQRLISELDGKVGALSIVDELDTADVSQEASSSGDPLWSDLTEGLESLDFERAEISRTLKALQRAERPDSLDSALRHALKILRPQASEA